MRSKRADIAIPIIPPRSSGKTRGNRIFETNDRTEQVNQLKQLAQDLTSNQWKGTAEQIVQFWLDSVNDAGVELPSWFDDFDNALLVDFLKRAQDYPIIKRDCSMTKGTQRNIAMSAARQNLKSSGFTESDLIYTATADDCLGSLNDLAMTNSNLVASHWFVNASRNELNLFAREWRKWQTEWRQLNEIREISKTNLYKAADMIRRL